MAALSKEEYLKRYLSDDKPDSKKKKKKPKSTIQPKLKVIDDDIDFKTLLPDNLGNTLEEDVGDNDPTVAEIVDERPVHIKRLEEYRASGKWRTLNEKKNDLSNQLGVIKNNSDEDSTRIKRHDSDSDQSPPRIKIHDPDSDQSPPRIKRYDSDSDQSPPRIKRHDSDSDQSPPRIKRHDSDSDQSLTRKNRHHSGSDNSERRKLNSHERHRNLHKQSHQSYERRRRHDSDSDQSPPRRKKHSDTIESQQRRRKQHNSDSDQSPPRKQRRHSDSDQSPPRKQRRHSDSDQSPPRKQRRHSDSDQSPPRKQRRHSDSDQSPPRRGERRKTEGESKKATKTLSGAKAGLQSARDMKLEAEVIRRREDEAFKKIGEDKLGRYATTVHRDKSGKRRNLEEEKKKEKEADEKKAEEDKKYMEWGQGLKQKEEREKQLLDNLHEITKPLARYRDDEDLDSMLKEKIRDGDPMAMFMKKKKNTNATGDANEKPKYRGPQPPPNRYGIMPGYRWDGVDRSNGFEAKLFAHKAERRAVDMMAYKWSTEDM